MSTTLPLGDINIVAVTDVHSWVAGHGRKEPHLNADYGDVMSFYQHLTDAANDQGKDVFFVMNGDFVDGTGLSTIPPDHLTPILEQMPFHAVNMGNHELYHNETVAFLHESGFIDHWKGNYLTTNTYWQGPDENFVGHPYTYLYGQHSQTKILTFGFLYNFEDNCEITKVKRVQETVQMDWFRAVLLNRDYDAILVLAHMDCIDPLVAIIHKSIRALVGLEIPIQFVNGHSHRRCFHQYDKNTVAFEPGNFLNTVGFASFPTRHSVQHSDTPPEALYHHVFIDANTQELAEIVGNFSKTEEGMSLSDFIHNTQDDMGLEHVLGCAPQSYPDDLPVNDTNSLHSLYMRHVFPFVFGYNDSKVFAQRTGALRYSLFKGEVTVDDLIAVSPFEDNVSLAADHIWGSDILATFGDFLSTARDPSEPPLPFLLSGPGIEPDRLYDVYAGDFDLPRVRQHLESTTGRNLSPPTLFRYEDGTIVTTSVVWRDFVVHNWPCTFTSFSRRLEYGQNNDLVFGNNSLICLSVLAVIALFVGARHSRKSSKEESGDGKYPVRDYGSINTMQ